MKKIQGSKINVSKKIIRYSPSDYPLLSILRVKMEHENKSSYPQSECSNPKFGWYYDDSLVENYLQIFRTDFSDPDVIPINPNMSSSATLDIKKNAIEHLKKIENAFWNGKRKLCSACGQLIRPSCDIDKPSVRKTGGVIQFLKENKNTFKLKEKFSKKEFNDFLRKGFTYGDDSKMLFVDERSFEYLSKMYKGKLEKRSPLVPFLFDYSSFETLVSIHGKVNIIKTPALKSTICLLDMKEVYYRYLRNRDTFFRANLQKLAFQDVDCKNDEEYKKLQEKRDKLKPVHDYITECGLMITAFDNHLLGIIK